MPKIKRFIIDWVPALIWMAVIFSASGDSSSFQRSSRIIEPIVRWLFPHISDSSLDLIILLVRKCAHLTEFAVLGLLLLRAFRRQAGIKDSGWRWRPAWMALLLVILYASSDEFHQLFVPHRQASVLDVLIDSTGAVGGLLLAWLITRWRSNRKSLATFS